MERYRGRYRICVMTMCVEANMVLMNGQPMMFSSASLLATQGGGYYRFQSALQKQRNP